jgi:large repetitive protein
LGKSFWFFNELLGMKKLFFLLTIAFAFFASSALRAQVEICDNGIDDDFDGFIDCYDPDCANHSWCDGFYIGNDVLCESVPSAFPKFTMTLDFASPNETTNHIGRMSIGDLDRDGIPEIVTMNRYTKKLFILNGNDGSIKKSLDVKFEPLWEIALGNIDNDNCAELFFQGIEGKSLYIYAYDCDLNLIWKTKIRDQNGNQGNAMDTIEYGLADFDGDGKVELYVKDMVLDAHTGTIIINTASTDDASWNKLNGGPVAVDIMGDDRLELVLGCDIYDINLGTRTANSGTRTLLKSLPQYQVKYPYNATSVADYNLDGYLDILASGGENIGGKLYTTVFFWDVQNDVFKTYSDPIPGNFNVNAVCSSSVGPYYQYGWQNGTGRLNVADLDGDGLMNVSYVSGKYLYALDENLQLLWRININEETSGYTGCTLFDFNGDGSSEIVYRDERFLYIINGADGSIFSQQPCISRTQREYPIVADVDGDGSTELCVTCGYNDQDAADNFCNLSYSRYSQVRVYKSAAEPWVPARRLWNQHGYFNVNVNDDLTIPRKQQKHHLIWSVGSCTVGPNRPLNNFLNQSPFLNSQGCPTYAAPNLAYVDNSLSVNPPTCPNGNFTVSFQIQNLGDIELSGDVPITFYQGDPEQAGATKLNTVMVTLNNFGVGKVYSVNNVTVNGPGSNFVLYIVLNDAGTSVPTPIVLPNTNFVECDYTDNIISSPINPLPVTITALKVQDNVKCVGSGSPDNGAVRAFIPVGGGENTADYNFYWSIGAVAKPVASADHVGATYNNLADGTYTVYAIHKTASCSSDTATVVVDRVDHVVSVAIVEERSYTNCKTPNGKLRAVVNGGDPVGNFTYAWYEGNDIFTSPLIGVSHIINNLMPITYTVLVTEKATGCQSIESYTLPDLSVQPVVSVVKTDLLCSNANSGSASASVGGVLAGYDFSWYKGNTVKPSPDYSGDTYTNLAAGNYTVVATDQSTKCASNPVTITLTQTTPPVVSASVTANQTSCDAAQPNGGVSADVGGATAGYTFNWFAGQNTLPGNLVASASSAAGLPAGVYTVKATDDATGCFATKEVTVINNVTTPSIVMGAIGSSTNCNTPNGSITANVMPDTPADYTFFWYKGTSIKASPDFADTDNVLDGLEPGDYTVRAIHNTKFCETAPATATVADASAPVNIAVNGALTVLPNDCNNNDGAMTVNISAPGNVGGFDVSWYKGTAPNPPVFQESGVTTSSASNLSSGLYTIIVVNRDNGCQSSAVFDLPFANAHKLLLKSKTDVDKCAPDDIGQIVVDLIPTQVPPGLFDEGDYEIQVYMGTNDLGFPDGTAVGGQLIQTISGVVGTTSYSTNNNLVPGWYTLVAISNNPLTPGCRSVPVQVEIKQIVNDPLIVASQLDANMNCSGVIANGRIELDIDSGAPATDYIINWFEGQDTSAPTLGKGTSGSTSGNGAIAQNLPAGFYTVEVINNTPSSTGCSSMSTFQVIDNPPIISIPSANLSINNLTRCDINDASATVTDVLENGVSASLGNYTFAWFDSGMNPLPGNTNSMSGLAVGTYYVQATNTVNNCATATVEFEIKDMIMGTIGVDLVSFVQPTQCLKPANLTGQLTVNATGSSGSGYTYNWYLGASASGPVVGNNPTLAGITIPGGRSDITYTVEVINNDNQCQAVDTYILPLEVSPIELSASAAPLTSCDTDDGVVFAAVTTPNGNDYNYNWFIGNAVKPMTDFPAVAQPAKQINNLTAGDYTVVAVDNSDAGCETQPITVTIENQQVMPSVTIMGLAPVSNCDPARPNGVASALVDGNFTDYRFEWFEGPDDTGTMVYVGSEPGNLKPIQYTVRATNLVSGCSATASITILDKPEIIPVVDVEILSNVTSCVSANGALSASVNGNTADYVFDWYIGSSVKATPDFSGETFKDLDVGTYTVTATSKITGCVSAPASQDIIEDLTYPDFDFGIQSASCDMDDGYVTLFLLTDVEIEKIEWNNNGVITTGPNLSDIPAGEYSVTVTSTLGCSTTKDVEIKTEIHPFNGISRNNDGANELFYINCIGDFPSNIVRIFNRAGTLVYEAEGYDNIDVYFDGKSNRGIAVLGNNLPDGTYFYVIDKRDGSKPLAGYLEIVN